MSTTIIATDTSKGELTRAHIDTLVQSGIVPPNTPEAQVKLFAQVCSEKKLSPFSKEIYLVGYGNKYSIITGIDGMRTIAARTGELAGCDDAKFNMMPNGTYNTAAELIAAKQLPKTCTVTVYRVVAGTRCPFTHTAAFSEFNSGQQKWASMPFQMIAKTAEGHAIRKGFADACSGLHIEEEAAALQDITILNPNISAVNDDVQNIIAAASSLQSLGELWNAHKAQWSTDRAICALVSARKAELVKPTK